MRSGRDVRNSNSEKAVMSRLDVCFLRVRVGENESVDHPFVFTLVVDESPVVNK